MKLNCDSIHFMCAPRMIRIVRKIHNCRPAFDLLKTPQFRLMIRISRWSNYGFSTKLPQSLVIPSLSTPQTGSVKLHR